MSSTPKPDTSVSIVPLGRRRIHCHLLLPAIGILVITAGLGLALILYLLANKIPGQTLHQIVVNGSFYADEGLKYTRDGKEEVNLRGLLITSLTVRFTFFIRKSTSPNLLCWLGSFDFDVRTNGNEYGCFSTGS
jgi:hypothetical protein